MHIVEQIGKPVTSGTPNKGQQLLILISTMFGRKDTLAFKSKEIHLRSPP